MMYAHCASYKMTFPEQGSGLFQLYFREGLGSHGVSKTIRDSTCKPMINKCHLINEASVSLGFEANPSAV